MSNRRGFRTFNKVGNKPIPDATIDTTKFNDETYKKHYVDGFREWKNFEVYLILSNEATVSTFKVSDGSVEFGNNAWGTKWSASGDGSSGKVGIESKWLGQNLRYDLLGS